MEGIDTIIWTLAIIPILCGGIGFWLFRRSRRLGLTLISGAAGFVIIDSALLVFFSGFMV